MRTTGRFLAGVIVLGLLSPAFAADRTADEIIKEFDAIKQPKTMEEYKKGSEQKAALVAELQKVDPENAKLKTLLPQRWMALMVIDKNDIAIAECEAVLASSKDETLKKEAAFSKAQALLGTEVVDADKALAAIDAFEKMSPKDRRMVSLLYGATQSIEDPAKLTAVEDRLLNDESVPAQAKEQLKPMIEASREMRKKVGKPFELEFTEATKGTTINMKDLKGKVVVVDFWATWCGPCIAEMPKMKKIYAEYKDKGVEFIGVSLDKKKEEGGLDKLKEYVTKNDIQWPQYYQGNFWQSEFSKGWGINSIPCVFMVDQDGNLYSVKARGKLEKMIPELLKKSKKDAAAGGQ